MAESNEVEYNVRIQVDGIDRCLSMSESMSILDAGINSGLDIPYDCRSGNCQRCVGRISSGIVEMNEANMKDHLVKLGYVLTCVAYPRSDIVMNIVDESELYRENKS